MKTTGPTLHWEAPPSCREIYNTGIPQRKALTLRQNPRDPACHGREREQSAARCGPRGALLIERLASHPTAKKSLCLTKSASIDTAAGGLQMDPSSKEECERVAHESLQRSEGTGGDLSVLSTRGEELSASSCSHNVIFVFRKLELSLENKGRERLKVCIPTDHSTPPAPPTMATSGAISVCHSNQRSLSIPSRSF